jgi:hypothetical protein
MRKGFFSSVFCFAKSWHQKQNDGLLQNKGREKKTGTRKTSRSQPYKPIFVSFLRQDLNNVVTFII